VVPWDLKQAVTELGEEFERREMRAHLTRLGQFWRSHLVRVSPPDEWGIGMVIEWLCLLRIGPFAQVYPVLPRHTPCPRCRSVGSHGSPATFTRASWPGGCLEECRVCATKWLHLDG
jgi:hypothetical protein